MVISSEIRPQAVSGLVPPQNSEALIRELWPSVTVAPGIASMGKMLIRTIIFAPLGWLLLSVPYFFKIMPFVAKRYTLTNRRLMVQRGLKPKPTEQIDLAHIDDVRLKNGEYDMFFRSGTIEIMSEGKVAMTLVGVPGADAFRHAVLQACMAWAPKKS